jgi:hypothetical protein
MRGNIRVLCRVRPLLQFEMAKKKKVGGSIVNLGLRIIN